MKSQFIELKVVVEIITDEEISYTEAEKLVKENVGGALEARFNSLQVRAEQWCPPWYKVASIETNY